MVSLTKEEALRFVEEKLKIPEVERSFERDRHGLLNDMVRFFYTYAPFQTLTNFDDELQLRCIPNFEKIKEDVLSGRGGMCVTLNGFFCALLNKLGYVAYLTAGYCFPTVLVITHAVIIVSNVRETGDRYFVDAGFGYHARCVVPLDFETESSTEVDNIWFRKFVKLPITSSGDIEFDRLHKRRNSTKLNEWDMSAERRPDEWINLCRFTLKTYSIQELIEAININVYQNPKHWVSRTIFITNAKDGRCVHIRNNYLLTIRPFDDTDGCFEGTLLETEADMIDAIRREFPVFEDERLIRAQLSRWRAAQNSNRGNS